LDPALTVSVWDTATGKRRHVLVGHTSPIICLAFSPDERLLATGSFDNRLMLWDLKTGRRVATYCGHDAGVFGVSFCDEGRQVVSLGRNGPLASDSVIKIWDATHPPECLMLKSRTPQILVAMFTPDSSQVVALELEWNGNGTCRVRLWDSVGGKEMEQVRFDTVLGAMTFSSDGLWIVAGGQGGGMVGQVVVWDRKLGRLAQSYPAPGQDLIGAVQCVACSPDGKLLAAAGWDRLVHVWDTTTGARKFRIAGHETTVGQLAFSADGRRLTSVSWPSHGVCPDDPNANPLKLRADDFTKPCEVRVWDTATGAELCAGAWPFKSKSGFAPVLSPDGEAVAVRTSFTTLTLYHVATQKELVTLRGLTHKLGSVAVSPDGRRIVTSGEFLKVYDTQTGRLILTLDGRCYSTGRVTFSPNGRKIVTADFGDLRIWDATPLEH
jgi:WD40 repeat protein